MMTHCVVGWSDGSFDSSRDCIICHSGPNENRESVCKHPVYKEYYREVVTSRTYWDWMEENGLMNETGEAEEFVTANPDVIGKLDPHDAK